TGGEVRGDRALPHAALAGDDGHRGPDRRHPRPEPGLLGLDLPDDVGPAIPGDVPVAPHGSGSSPAPSSPDASSGVAAGSRRWARKRRMRSGPRTSPGAPARSVAK